MVFVISFALTKTKRSHESWFGFRTQALDTALWGQRGSRLDLSATKAACTCKIPPFLTYYEATVAWLVDTIVIWQVVWAIWRLEIWGHGRVFWDRWCRCRRSRCTGCRSGRRSWDWWLMSQYRCTCRIVEASWPQYGRSVCFISEKIKEGN